MEKLRTKKEGFELAIDQEKLSLQTKIELFSGSPEAISWDSALESRVEYQRAGLDYSEPIYFKEQQQEQSEFSIPIPNNEETSRRIWGEVKSFEETLLLSIPVPWPLTILQGMELAPLTIDVQALQENKPLATVRVEII